MNLEVEICVILKDPDAMREKLRLLDAKLIGTKHQVDHYFHPTGENLREKDRYLRIRIENDTTTGRLEYNIGKTEYSAEEYEVDVSDVQMTEKILQELHYKKVVTVDKTRETWKYENFNIVLDTLMGIGDYMEVELMNTETEKAEELIWEFLKQNGFSEKDMPNPKNYYDIVLANKA